MSKNPPIKVVCAIIRREEKTLISQRSETSSLPGKWEFPGGKIEGEETIEQALKREIKEELGVDIHIDNSLPPNTHSYDKFTVTLIPFICSTNETLLTINEHQKVIWVNDEELLDYDWADADVPILKSYLEYVMEEK